MADVWTKTGPTRWNPVTDEPVRGAISPAWLSSLPGLERVRMLASGKIPPAPLAHLFGFRIGHVSPGTVIATMPASANFIALPAMDIAPFVILGTRLAATTAIAPGYEVVPITLSVSYFRSGRPRPGNLLARARLLNVSSLFVSAEVEIEDPEGRQLGHAVSQWTIRPLDPPPPAAPDTIETTDQPTYSTPDPPDRPAPGLAISADLIASRSGLEVAQMLVDGELAPLPMQHLLGARWVNLADGEVTQSMPASPWFCRSSHFVSEEVISAFLNQAGCVCMLGELGKSQSAAALESNYRFLESIPADGRELRARARVAQRSGPIRLIDAEVSDADGRLVAIIQGSAWSVIDRADRRVIEPERVLATLLFTDIVGSTERAEQMGDPAWRRILGEHHGLVRQELAAHRGREIKTLGDGFMARFETPAAAVRCARAIRDGVRRLDLEIRAGVHTGECEVQGSDLAGITVHVAARIMAESASSEVLVSQTVKELCAGSGLHFTPRGAQELKNVSGEWALYSVE